MLRTITFFSLTGLALLAGCAGSVVRMQEVSSTGYAPTPAPGKALVVFMRPSGLGFAVQSTVYEVKENEVDLIGIVAAKTKVAYQADPGKRLFMAVGENADFMSAELVAGRTYYATVAPRMGMWKARFALDPIRLEDLESTSFKNDFEATRWVVRTAETDQWFLANRSSVQSKRSEAYAEWTGRPESERPVLRASDGR